ncbi:MAG: hypothetical protein MUF52_08460 [Syntrophobacteraceae bacterium]|jgi:tungstate transport system substrate-binding protein|nr:hypothetical protein [Syntrophobacteraceae bacterium]
MTATPKRAHDEQGHFMTDTGTWVAEKQNRPNLKFLYKGDNLLVNIWADA